MSSFTDGYNYIKDNAGSFFAATKGVDVANYANSVETEIQNLLDHLNAFKGSAKDIGFLKGDVAEFWHGDTYNINAALNKSTNRMTVPRGTGLGSVDVQSTFDVNGEKLNYSLKYYKNGEASAKAQAQSVLEASHGKQGSGIDPLYAGQYRLIPIEQIPRAEEFLKRKIAEESIKRPEQAARYREALAMLREKIDDGQGNSSIALSEKQARELAQLAKEGNVTEDVFGLEAAEKEMIKQSIQDICKAGLTAATISLILKTTPEIIKAIDQLINNGEVDEKQFETIGVSAISGSAEGFIRGSLSAGIMACLKHEGINASPSVVGALTVIAFDTMKNAYAVTKGEKTRQELANDLFREIYVSGWALVGGGVMQHLLPELPVLGYMLGSFLGSTIGSLTYDYGYKKAISFCVDSGFAMFGLVEQDYTLPESIMREIGIDVFDYDTFDVDSFEPETFTISSFQPESFNADHLQIAYLRRGVIGVSRIGYIT